METAPKDGSEVYVRRVHNGHLVSEGLAVFGFLAVDAPSRFPIGPDPLGRLSATQYAAEARSREEWTATPRWLQPDRRYAFPEPTAWRSSPQTSAA